MRMLRSLAIRFLLALVFVPVTNTTLLAEEAAPAKPAKKPQYQHESILIPAASAEEPLRSEFSLSHAVEYVDQGALAWRGARKCISCHTTGVYLQMRPSLTAAIGPPPESMRDFFITELEKMEKLTPKKLKFDITPTKVAYLAAGLAEWDQHVTGKLSAETDRALRLMFAAQSNDGSWNNQNCWPPIESSPYHAATIAVMAAAAAPQWIDSLKPDDPLRAKLQLAKEYLRDSKPPHDYARLLLLWASTRVPDLIDNERKQQITKMILGHQQEDGGWSLRHFATPEQWGAGGRAKKLRAEAEFKAPPSDGHQTGLALLVLREAGVAADDARLQKGVAWLQSNQRESGRWWTRSLNTDNAHYITYSGSVYPLVALMKCGAIQPKEPVVKQKPAAIELPDSATGAVAQGEKLFRSGAIDDSIKLFDHAVQLEPARAPYLWQRGISHYYA